MVITHPKTDAGVGTPIGRSRLRRRSLVVVVTKKRRMQRKWIQSNSESCCRSGGTSLTWTDEVQAAKEQLQDKLETIDKGLVRKSFFLCRDTA